MSRTSGIDAVDYAERVAAMRAAGESNYAAIRPATARAVKRTGIRPLT
ncbi:MULTISPECIES: hypothetical protein [unclassified Rhodococcus (in: high G+C Gram-positive bacteria)]|nr:MULTISPECIES: hypothetical protein [unclassified Rhodococcus (in: high G+C Gram-positive bacteria)]